MGRAKAVTRAHWWQRPKTMDAVSFYTYVSPWIVGFLVFTLGPMVVSVYFSLTDWDMLSPAEFVGLGNFIQLLTRDRIFYKSAVTTAYYTFGSVPLGMVVGLLIAMLMNSKVRGITVFRTIYYLPSLVSGVAVALLWRWVFNPQMGVINGLLWQIGIKGPGWVFSEDWVIPSFIIMSLWGVGGSMIIYLASLQGVPSELYEAANIDGAGSGRRFLAITLPMISPVLFFNLIMGMIGSFQVFTQSFVMTEGGPNNASLFLVLYLYRNAFQYFKMGYASALAWVLFAIIMVFTLLVFRSSSVWVYYESEVRR
ncbi:MAG: carbohydrate ABC transporter permease [Anaerolineae bacterium]